MAKKNETFNIGKRLKVSDVIGTFDKNEDGAYIVIVDGKEYLLDNIAEYFLGGIIALDSCNEA